MIQGLKTNLSFKNFNEPWLLHIPTHWAMVRLKSILKERVVKGYPDEPMLAATQTKGVVRKEDYENRTVLAQKDLHLLKLVKKNDFVISLRSFQGGIEYAREQGIISPAYTILFCSNPMNQAYLAWLLKSRPFIENLTLFVTGIRQGQNIDYENLSRSKVPLPPLEEQDAIVRFLDHADRRIRRYIHARQKLIKLLEEQKQAIIHRAVTRGLDPSVRLKPSGVEWLGEIPVHWIIRKTHTLFREQGSGTTPNGDHYYGGDIPFIMSGDLNDGTISVTKRSVTRTAIDENNSLRLFPPQSIIIAMYGATIGKTGILEFEACTNQACCVLAKPYPEINIEFVQSVFRTARPFLIRKGYGGGQPNINAEIVRSLRIPLPCLNEQNLIIERISEETGKINRIKTIAETEISLLKEFRTRFIADVVTGKLDVREAAARLPEETDDEEAFEVELAEEETDEPEEEERETETQ